MIDNNKKFTVKSEEASSKIGEMYIAHATDRFNTDFDVMCYFFRSSRMYNMWFSGQV